MPSQSSPPQAHERISYLRRAIEGDDARSIDTALVALGIVESERDVFLGAARRVSKRAQERAGADASDESRLQCELALGVLAALHRRRAAPSAEGEATA